MQLHKLWLVGVVVTALAGCDMIPGMGYDPKVAEPAAGLLRTGDLPKAATKYEELWQSNKGHYDVAVGLSFTKMLAGQYAEADAILGEAEAKATEDQLKELKLRRAMLALERVRKGDSSMLDVALEHAKASGLPAARLIEAENLLLDFEEDQAKEIFRSLQAEAGAVGEAAQQYLAFLDVDSHAGMAEVSATWALNWREDAVKNVIDELAKLPSDYPDRDALALLWAGRAVVVKQPDKAEVLLGEVVGNLPKEQAWRVQATQGMIKAAQGDAAGAKRVFDQLRTAGAPPQGIADAQATAAALCQNRADAKVLTEGLESNATARGLLEAGAPQAAKAAGADGALNAFLEGR